MLRIHFSTRFKKDMKRCASRGLDVELLKPVIDTLCIPAPLPEKYCDHPLQGGLTGHRECHVEPDWLLLYRINGDLLELVRTGTHADLFKK